MSTTTIPHVPVQPSSTPRDPHDGWHDGHGPSRGNAPRLGTAFGVFARPVPADPPAYACRSLSESLVREMFPTPRHLVPVACFLVDAYFTAESIERILEHCNRFGTANCCAWLDDQADIDAIEALLPRDGSWDDARWDEYIWSDGPGPEAPRVGA